MAQEYLFKYFPMYCAEVKINNELIKDLEYFFVVLDKHQISYSIVSLSC